MILVFGGGGQLATELARMAAARGQPLVTVARSECDVANDAEVAATLERYSPRLVVNTAAYTKVDRAEIEVEEARRGNEIGPTNLARQAAQRDIPLVHMSTDYVFDGTKSTAYVEDDRIAPLGVYGRTKADGEGRVRAHQKRHIILRTSWLYGAFGHNFLKTMLEYARTRDELRVVDDQRGSPTSTHAIADAILRIAPSMLAGSAPWGTYHFAGTGMTTWYGFAQRILSAAEPWLPRLPPLIPITTAQRPTPARRPANSVLDCSRFASAFGFSAAPWGEDTDAVVRELLRS